MPRQVMPGKICRDGKSCRVIASFLRVPKTMQRGRTCRGVLGMLCRSVAASESPAARKSCAIKLLLAMRVRGTRLADQTAGPSGQAYDRTATSDDRSEAVDAAAATPAAAIAECRRLSIAVVDNGFLVDGS